MPPRPSTEVWYMALSCGFVRQEMIDQVQQPLLHFSAVAAEVGVDGHARLNFYI
jgi:hypothetical protein